VLRIRARKSKKGSTPPPQKKNKKKEKRETPPPPKKKADKSKISCLINELNVLYGEQKTSLGF
jgi:hypothetical protein